jgi:cyclophilin family peptidyl-prolyl cis-trans isomerase
VTSVLLFCLSLLQTSHAPPTYRVRLDTSKGAIVIAVHRDWAPHGADRFYELVTTGYYDNARFFRVIKDKWAQFGIAADAAVSQAWRSKTIPDDPWKGVSNTRGTVAFAFKEPNGRATQVFINLKDNSATHDREPFIVFGEVVEGMKVGSKYLTEHFPLLDYIRKAEVLED